MGLVILKAYHSLGGSQCTLCSHTVISDIQNCLQAVSQEDGTDLEPSGQNDLRTPDNADLGTPKDGAPALGTILKGRVHAIKPFGIFVAFDGWRNHALVHHRQAGVLAVAPPHELLLD